MGHTCNSNPQATAHLQTTAKAPHMMPHTAHHAPLGHGPAPAGNADNNMQHHKTSQQQQQQQPVNNKYRPATTAMLAAYIETHAFDRRGHRSGRLGAAAHNDTSSTSHNQLG